MAAAFGGETRLLAVFGRFTVSYTAGSGIIRSCTKTGAWLTSEYMLRHDVALASCKLTRVGNGGQLIHMEVIMSRPTES